jgi:hypothetical protein
LSGVVGQAAVCRSPALAAGGDDALASPSGELPILFTHRTTMVPRAIAGAPRSSNAAIRAGRWADRRRPGVKAAETFGAAWVDRARRFGAGFASVESVADHAHRPARAAQLRSRSRPPRRVNAQLQGDGARMIFEPAKFARRGSQSSGSSEPRASARRPRRVVPRAPAGGRRGGSARAALLWACRRRRGACGSSGRR